MNNNLFFQRIFDELEPVLPIEWKKLALYIYYGENSYSIKYYTAGLDGVFTDCFKQVNVNRAQLVGTFININKIIEPVRNALVDSKKWSVMTMLVDSEGHMKTEFDYTDVSENQISYAREWKSKYLK